MARYKKYTTFFCSICNNAFELPPWQTKRRPNGKKYCSKACKYLGHRKRVIKECRYCKQPFEVIQSMKDAIHYCSKSCRIADGWIISDPSKRSVFVCDWCERKFEAWTYRQPRFCSRQCTSEFGARQPKPNARKPEIHITLECATCVKEYQTTTHQVRLRGSKFCSLACSGVACANRMRGPRNPNWKGGITSHEYGENWGAQKRKTKRRDNHTCQVCGYRSGGNVYLDVHHIIPIREFDGDWKKANELTNLISLCRCCHPKVECGKIQCPPISMASEVVDL